MPCLAWPFPLSPLPPFTALLHMQRPHVRLSLCVPSLHQALSFRPVFIQFLTSPVRRTKRNAQLYATFLLLATVDTVDSGTGMQTYSGTLDNCQSRVDIVTAFGPLLILFSLSLSLSLPVFELIPFVAVHCFYCCLACTLFRCLFPSLLYFFLVTC